MDIPVNRDSSEREAAGVHGEVDKEVDHFAHEGAEHPVLQGVDGGLERDAEDDEEEVGHAQVEYEQVGGVVSDLAAPQKHSEHQAVADGAQQEDQGEDHRHNHTGGVQLVAFRNIRLPSCLTEILKVRHVASLKEGKRDDACVKKILYQFFPCLLDVHLESHQLTILRNRISQSSIIHQGLALWWSVLIHSGGGLMES